MIEGGKFEEERLRSDMRQLMTNGWQSLAAQQLTDILNEVQDRNNRAQERQRAIHDLRTRVNLLREQIKGWLMHHMPPEASAADDATYRGTRSCASRSCSPGEKSSTDGLDLDRERRINGLIDRTTVSRYREKQGELNTLTTAQFERGRRLNAIKDRLRDNDAAKIRSLAADQDRLEGVIEDYERQLRTFGPRLNEIATQQQSLARSLARLPGPQPSLTAESQFFQYVRALLFRTIARYQDRTREEVQKTASEMFVKLVHDPQGYKGLRIGSDYRVDLLEADGNAIETSEGGNQLVALSLIGALKQAAVRAGPVVLDSPLARLDKRHRENVLQKWVPSLGSQVVLLVQSGELTRQEAHRIMGNTIGREYRIYRPKNDPDEAEIESLT